MVQSQGESRTGLAAGRPVPPRTPYEDVVMEIWRDVLGVEGVGVLDDFFEVGGHSLLATRVVARIRKVLGVHVSVKELFETPTVAALAASVAERSATGTRAVTPRPPDAEPVLSFGQERLWLEHQLLPGAAYNIHARRRLLGPVDVDALAASVQAICDRHEVLRTRFRVIDGRPVPVVDDSDRCQPDVVDLTGTDDRGTAVRRMLDEDSAAVFDLAQEPPFRCRVLRLSDTEHLLSVTMHHIVSDEWSMGVFVRELVALYEAGGDPERAGLPPLPVQYRDFAHWERGYQSGTTLQRGVDYWRKHLHGAAPVLRLPAAPGSRGATRDRAHATITAEQLTSLHTLCRTHGVTPFMVMLAALATVLRRWSGQQDVVIGVPIAGRTEHGTEDLIGCFVNVLPIRVSLPDNPTFGELLLRVRAIAVEGYANADTPFDVLVKELRIPRDPRHSPLFQVVLNVVGTPADERLDGITVQPLDDPDLPAKFDLAFDVRQVDGLPRIRLEYDAARYRADLTAALLEQFRTLLVAVVDDAARGVLDYRLEPVEDTDPSVATDPPAAAHRAVADHAGQGNRVAVIDDTGEWGYRWLDSAAERVAAALVAHGITAGDRVALLAHPSAACVATFLGCQRARLRLTLVDDPDPTADVVTTVAVTPAAAAAGVLDFSALFLDDVLPPPLDRADTSPFAGDWAVDRFDLDRRDRFAVTSRRPAHLLAALSGAMHAGGTLVLSELAHTADEHAIIEWLRAQKVSVVHTTPPTLRALAGTSRTLPALRYAFVENRGDLFGHDVGDLRRLSPASRLVGVFRTDDTGRPLAAHVLAGDQPVDSSLRVPLGRPLPTEPVVLETPAGPAAVGEVAEVRVGDRRTGDRVRRWPDGTFEYVARDGGGSTSEADATMLALRDLPDVRDALLVDRPTAAGERSVVGYLVGSELRSGDVRQRIDSRLPDSLVPDHLVCLDRFPLTSDGEYDLAVLPPPGPDTGRSDGYLAPRTPIERQLVALLHELLEVERVGIRESFFDLGGFSLLATQLLARMEETFQVDVPLPEVFESPTIEGLAQIIVRAQAAQLTEEQLAALLTEIETA